MKMKVCGCCLHEQNIHKQKCEDASPAMHISASRSRAAENLAAKAVAQQHRRGQQLRKYFQRLYSESGRRERLPYAPTPRYFRPKPRTRKSPSRLSLPVTCQPEPIGGRRRFTRWRRNNPRIPTQMKPPYIYDSQSDLETRKEIKRTCQELNEMLSRAERMHQRPQRKRRECTRDETILFNPKIDNRCPKVYPRNSFHETATLMKKNSNPYYQSHRHHNHHQKSSSLLGFRFDSNCLLAEMTNEMKSSSSLLSHPFGLEAGAGAGGDAEETSRSQSPTPSPSPTEAELTTTPCQETQPRPRPPPPPPPQPQPAQQQQQHRKQPNEISNVAPPMEMPKILSNQQLRAPHSWPQTTPWGSTVDWKKSAATSPLCPAAGLSKQSHPPGSFAGTPLPAKNIPGIKSEQQFFAADVLYTELTRPPSGFLRRWCSGDDGQLHCSKGCEVHCPKESNNAAETIATPSRESRSKFIAIIENAIGKNSNRKEVKKRKSRRQQRSSDIASLDHNGSNSQKYKGLEPVAQAVQKTESNPLITDNERRLCSTIAFLLENHQRHNKIASDLSSCTTSVEHAAAATSGDATPTNNTVPSSRRYLEQLRRLRCDHLRHIKREIRQLESLERFLHPGHFFKDIT